MARHVWFAICIAVYLPGIWSKQSQDWRIMNIKLNILKSNFDNEIPRLRLEIMDLRTELELERARTDDLERTLNDTKCDSGDSTDATNDATELHKQLKSQSVRIHELERSVDNLQQANAVEDNSKTAVKVMENFAKSIKQGFKSEKLRLRNITDKLNLKSNEVQHETVRDMNKTIQTIICQVKELANSTRAKLTDLQLAVDADKLGPCCLSDSDDRTCRPEEFDCGDNVCVPQARVCDGQVDCGSGKDEQACANPVSVCMKCISDNIICGTVALTDGTCYDDSVGDLGCVSPWIQIHRSCYTFFYDDMKSWDDAEQICVKMGGHLMSITNKNEMRKFEPELWTHVSNRYLLNWWVGLRRDRESDPWIWLDGEELKTKVIGWAHDASETEPCVELNYRVWIRDTNCSLKKPFICEDMKVTLASTATAPTRTTVTTTTTGQKTNTPAEERTTHVPTGSDLVALLHVGSRVVRGADWMWGDQDGNGPGTVTFLNPSPGWDTVNWDNGNTYTYRMGYDGKYDLALAPP